MVHSRKTLNGYYQDDYINADEIISNTLISTSGHITDLVANDVQVNDLTPKGVVLNSGVGVLSTLMGVNGTVLAVNSGNLVFEPISVLPAGDAATLQGHTWQAPDPIGSNNPNTGAFTTLSTTSTSLVSNLYAARSETVDTNAAVSGVVTTTGINTLSFTNGTTGTGAVVLQNDPSVNTLNVVTGDITVDVGGISVLLGDITVPVGGVTVGVGKISCGLATILSPTNVAAPSANITGATITGGLQVSVDASVGGTLSVIGITTLDVLNATLIRGTTDISIVGALTVIGNSTLTGPMTLNGIITTEGIDCTGAISGLILNVTGGTTIEGDVVVEGALNAGDVIAANCTLASLECGDIAVGDIEGGAIECGDISCANITAATIECVSIVAATAEAGIFIGLPL